jgi:hypothetical protein
MPRPARSAAKRRDGENSRREFWWGAGHIALLSSLAVAYPVFELLGRNAEFFVAHRTTALQIWLFAFVVAFAIPGVLVLLEAVCRFGPRWLPRLVHLGWIALLLGLALMRLIRAVTPSALWIGVGALVAGLGLTVAYARSHNFRDVLNWGAPAPLVMAALFLFTSSASSIALPRTAHASSVHVGSRAPVVFVVFDEFPSQSLMDSSYNIDAKRFPNIAALAKQSYWFRNSTTVDDFTPHAVPAILTGQRPVPNRHVLPIAAEHPNNLFSVFAGDYEFHAEETITDMCPRGRCVDPVRDATARGTRTLYSDAGLVYLHTVLPPRLTDALPPVGDSWANFGKTSDSPEAAFGTLRDQRMTLGEEARFGRLVDAIDADPASLYFTHVLLPHMPWKGVPTGQTYPFAGRAEGLVDFHKGGAWGPDAVAIHTTLRRHLLQIGYVDHLVGQLVAKLKSAGVYDNTLIVLVSDHGASFVPSTPRRVTVDANSYEIMPQTLLIKAPGQTNGVVSDRNVETIDVMPTIADLLDFKLPYHVDGSSAVDPAVPERPNKLMKRSYGGKSTRSGKRPDHFRLADEIARYFPHRDDEFDLYSAGPGSQLVGRKLADLEVTGQQPRRAKFTHKEIWADVNPSAAQLPLYAIGTVAVSPGENAVVALEMGGRIVATSEVFTRKNGSGQFSLLYPPSVLKRGRNDAHLFVLDAGRASPSLTRTTA